jgi:ATP-dependent DNA helicase PIF1
MYSAKEELSNEQKYALQKFKKGENIFVTGPGGTGKTKLIHHFVSYCSLVNKKYQVCALTGCAALLLKCDARTIHSWSGIKIARGDSKIIVSNVLKNRKAVAAWKRIQVLIIDEVSMMSKKIFEILEHLARLTRKNNAVFGGIQIVFTGDFFQLPPVGNYDDIDSQLFCFESELWQQVFPLENNIELVKIFRQNDPVYINILNEVRKGSISKENADILKGYLSREYKSEDSENTIIPTKLFPVKARVDHINNTMFDQLEDTLYTFESVIRDNVGTYLDNGKVFSPEIFEKCKALTQSEKEKEIEYLLNNTPCAKTIQLKKGATVMCTYNVDMDNGICNGSQGVIVDIIGTTPSNYTPIVKFHNGKVLTITMQYWQSEEYPCIAVGQIPLCLAYAMTIHKMQGTTLSMAEIDIGRTVFEYGQIYVALSRIQSLDGLYLLNFHPQKVKANPKVVEFYKLFEHNPIVLTNETQYEEHELEKEDIESTEEDVNTSDVLPAIKTIQSYAYIEEPINYKKIFIVPPNINNEIKTNTKTSPPSTTKVLKNVQIDTLWNTFSCKKKNSSL